MSLTDKLTNTDAKKLLIESLQRVDGQLFLYGAGLHAENIVNTYLTPHEIGWAGCFVDDEYWSSGATFLGKPVFALSQLNKVSSRAKLVLAMGNPIEAIARLKSKQVTEQYEVVALDPTTVHWETAKFGRRHIMDRKEDVDTVGEWLCDDLSIQTFIAFLNARLSGSPDEIVRLYQPRQYFPADLFTLTATEVVYDCGANIGDTLLEFLGTPPHCFSSYVGIEPENENAKKLRAVVERLSSSHKIAVYECGLWDSEGELFLHGQQTDASISDCPSERTVPVRRLDEIRAEQGMPCTLLKMDIEGSETMALRGGEVMIANDRPKMAINICHRPYDFIEIPQLLRNIDASYRLYLRHHHMNYGVETVLYAL